VDSGFKNKSIQCRITRCPRPWQTWFPEKLYSHIADFLQYGLI